QVSLRYERKFSLRNQLAEWQTQAGVFPCAKLVRQSIASGTLANGSGDLNMEAAWNHEQLPRFLAIEATDGMGAPAEMLRLKCQARPGRTGVKGMIAQRGRFRRTLADVGRLGDQHDQRRCFSGPALILFIQQRIKIGPVIAVA